jgi:hypothetical protein
MRGHFATRAGWLLFLSVSFFSVLCSQVDSTARSFFPAAVGNSWHYQYTPSNGFTTKITRDSTAGGDRFLFMNNATIPYYKIDSLLNVYSIPSQGAYECLLYKLDAKLNETWQSRHLSDYVRIVARVENVYWGFVLGVFTQIKQIGYYYQPYTDTTVFSQWSHNDYLAAGFGFSFQITEGMSTTAEELYGCVIDGKKYGLILSVNMMTRNPTLSEYKLYPAFPNPFNPTTTISFNIPQKSFVTLKVFDALGKEVSEVISEELPSGAYSWQWNAAGQPSGVYFCRLQAGSYMETNKLLLIR